MQRLRGISLVDLVIVMLIMGILSAAAAPRFVDSLARFRSEAAAKRVQADLNLARQHAKRTSSTQTVSFDAMSDSYVLVGLPDMDHIGNDYTVKFAQVGYPVDLTTASFSGTSMVTFDNYGRPDNPGSVVVQSGSYTRTIDVDASGVVKISP